MLNRAIIMGRLAADPELRYTPNNVPVVAFTLAVGRTYVKQGTERQTDWIDVVAWRQTAEFVSKYFKKGQQMAVEGTLQTRMYEDKNGNKRKAVEIVADNVFFAESKSGGASYDADPAPVFESGALGDFEEISTEDTELPF
jgi:single-strand DNA-binding protein